jgi:hypothetical protein
MLIASVDPGREITSFQPIAIRGSRCSPLSWIWFQLLVSRLKLIVICALVSVGLSGWPTT